MTVFEIQLCGGYCGSHAAQAKRYKRSEYSESRDKTAVYKNLDAIIAAEGGHHSIDVSWGQTTTHIYEPDLLRPEITARSLSP